MLKWSKELYLPTLTIDHYSIGKYCDKVEFTILRKDTKKKLQRATLYSQNQINQNRPKNSLFQPKRVYFKVKIEIFAFQFQLKLNSLLPGLPKGPFPAEIWIWQAQQVSSLYLLLDFAALCA